MSEAHAKRLNAVRFEFEATREALVSAIARAGLVPDDYRRGLEEFSRALQNAEKTYYVRIVAETEGMLYRHLRDYHPDSGITVEGTAARLIDATRHRLDPARGDALDNAVADEALEVVRYRNWLAHGEKSERPTPIPFDVALERLKRVLLALPPMKGATRLRRRTR